LRADYSQFIEREAEILVIGPDGPRAFRRYWDEQDMPFVGLADPRHTVADLYEQEVNLLKLGRMPTILIVDKAARIRFRHDGASMSDIPDNRTLLELLDGLGHNDP
jgi:peroxiredoxin